MTIGKSRFSEALRALRIYNDHALLKRFGEKGRDVWLGYSPPGRAEAQKTRVMSPSHKTDPKAHWTNDGCKTFVGRRAESMPKAMAWASANYRVDEWVSSPLFGVTHQLPKYVVDAARKAVKVAGTMPALRDA